MGDSSGGTLAAAVVQLVCCMYYIHVLILTQKKHCFRCICICFKSLAMKFKINKIIHFAGCYFRFSFNCLLLRKEIGYNSSCLKYSVHQGSEGMAVGAAFACGSGSIRLLAFTSQG